MNDLYYAQPCDVCGGFHNEAAGGDILLSPDIVETFLRKLYGGEFDTSSEIEPTIWRAVVRLLNEATVEGLSQSDLPPTMEDDFYDELRHSNEVFAAFKVHSMAVQMADKLFDEKGKLKSYRQWKDDVKSISTHYNGIWLRTEYNTAVIQAHNAADWRQFERNRDIMPNLRWMPTTSPHPEAEHRSFWERKLTRPIDDPFWNKHRPGNRWNCKCSLEATDDPITPLPEEDEINADKPQRGLENNPGKDGQLFSQKHPYFPKNCKECGFNKNKGKITNWFRNAGKDCNECIFITDAIDKIQKDFSQYKEIEPPYIKNYISLYNGKVLASPHHGANEWKDNEEIAKFLADKLKQKIYMLPRLDSNTIEEIELRKKLLPINIKKNKNPDFYIGGRTFDAKSLYDLKHRDGSENYKHAIQNKIKKAKNQAENIILDIPDFVPQKDIKGAIHGFFKVSHKQRTILVRYNDKLYIYKKRET